MDPSLENLITLIADVLVCDPSDITQHQSFADLGIDSLDHIQLIGEIEEHFEIEITDEEALAATSVDGLYHIILSKF
jgi:acyl carrier protein